MPGAGSEKALAKNWRNTLEADIVRLASDPAWRVHAVLDGAFFDNLQHLFDKHELAARPLFGGNTPQALVNAGPWLVDLYHLPHEEPDEPAPAEEDTEDPDLSDEALAAQADAMAETMRKAVEAGDDTGGLAPIPDEDAFPFGPPTDPARQVRTLMQLVNDKPAQVFWIGSQDLTHERLFRHLRGINKILVPKDDEPGSDSSATGASEHKAESGPDDKEAVFFRHADGNVLASVLPVLNESQFARLFGPALALTFHAPDHPDEDGWPIRRAVRPLPDAQAPAGMLALGAEQMCGVEAARYARLHKRTVEYLQRVGADKLEGTSLEKLQSDTNTWLTSGQAYGINSERALWKWCYLQLFTNGSLTQAPGLDGYMRRWPGNANHKIEHLMGATIARLKEPT